MKNYYSLFKIIPSSFKPVGIIVFCLSILIAFIQRFLEVLVFQDFSLKYTQLLCMFSLLVLAFTKGKKEDERQQELRLLVSFLGYYTILIFLLVTRVLEIFTYQSFLIEDVVNIVLVYLLLQIIFLEITLRTTLIDKYENYKPLFGVISMIAFILLLYFNSFFWVWGYFDGI